MKVVCDVCKERGHDSHISANRACTHCLENCEVCMKRVVLVFTVDCETGNKGAFEILRKSIEDESIDPYLSLLTVLHVPDCPDVGKTIKGSYSNWVLKLCNERRNLGILRTLRNRSSATIMAQIRKLLARNDHVKNKDRQDPSAVSAEIIVHKLESLLPLY